MNSIPRSPALDLNLLKVFEAVFRERHLTRAADALALTPSAVSHALRRLRTYLDDPLFRREGHTMVPTPACERLAPELFEHLEQLRRLLQRWVQFEPAQARQTFRIGMPEGVEVTLLPALQRAFFAAAPQASLACVGFDRAQLPRLLASGQVDVVVDIARPVREPLRHRLLLDDDFCIVARRGHPLGGAPTLRQYLAARHVAVSGRAVGTVVEDDALLRLGLQREVALRCQNYASAFAVVAASDLLLTVPMQLSRVLGAARTLQRWRSPFKLGRLPLHLYWHQHHDNDAAARWLGELIADVARRSLQADPRASASRRSGSGNGSPLARASET